MYRYDGDGHRVKRIVGSTETWQIYGVGGELLAEYNATNPNAVTLKKEYGYRNGQLLITAEPGTASAAPPSIVSVNADSNNVVVSWSGSASSYRVERKAAGGSFQLLTWTSSTSITDAPNPGYAYLHRVCAADTNHNCISGYSNVGLGARLNFLTDPTITGSTEDPQNPSSWTTIKAAHINELRTAINAVRSLAGLPAVATPNQLHATTPSLPLTSMT